MKLLKVVLYPDEKRMEVGLKDNRNRFRVVTYKWADPDHEELSIPDDWFGVVVQEIAHQDSITGTDALMSGFRR